MGPSDKCILEFLRTFRWLPSSRAVGPSTLLLDSDDEALFRVLFGIELRPLCVVHMLAVHVE